MDIINRVIALPVATKIIGGTVAVVVVIGVVAMVAPGGDAAPAPATSDGPTSIPLPADAFNGDPALQGAAQKLLNGAGEDSLQQSSPNPLQSTAKGLQAP